MDPIRPEVPRSRRVLQIGRMEGRSRKPPADEPVLRRLRSQGHRRGPRPTSIRGGRRTWIRATFRASAPSTTSRRPLLSPIEAASERRKGGSGDQSRHPGSALRFRMQEQSRRLQRRTSLRPFPQGARPSRARLTEVHTTDHPGPSTPRWIATAPRGLRNGCRRAPRSPGQGRHGRGLLVGGVRRVRHDLAGSTLPEALRDARCLGREVGAVGPQSDQRNSGRKA